MTYQPARRISRLSGYDTLAHAFSSDAHRVARNVNRLRLLLAKAAPEDRVELWRSIILAATVNSRLSEYRR
jgi:hypothetical protein